MNQAEFSCVDGDGTVPVESAMVNSLIFSFFFFGLLVERFFGIGAYKQCSESNRPTRWVTF
jgi:hypothetical protein